jgi:oxygen-independent coproporphyrinogen-3 oxidase
MYWHGEPFLALGPSAAGYLPGNDGRGVRTRNAPIKTWLLGEAPHRDELDARDYVLERLMTGLRTTRGVDLDEIAGVGGSEVMDRLDGPLQRAVAQGWLERDAGRLRATREGIVRLDAILRTLFAA